MRLLILGGTAFVGREVARQAVARGDRVTCLARGRSGDPEPGVRFAVGDRDTDEGLAEVLGEHWDAVVDVARRPDQVRRATRLRTEHYVFVSTGNVYADTATLGLTENAALLDPGKGLTAEEYGAGKVACELAVDALASSTVARVGLIGGPGDRTGRVGYWPWRFAHPTRPDGTVLVPDALDLPSQVIDVRDLARWLLLAATERHQGPFNVCGQTHPLGDLLETARGVVGHTGPLRAADPAWLIEHGVAEWAGPRSLPLWIADPGWRGFAARDASRALAHGLTLRPLEETLHDTWRWQETEGPPASGLSDDEETELLALLD